MISVKRMFSLILTGLCVFMLCCAGGAEEAGRAAETAEPAQRLKELGILQGDESGSLQEEKRVSRAEFAAMLMRFLKEEAESTAVKPAVFDDVPAAHWAGASIRTAYEKGLIEGIDERHFAPEEPVRYEEALKMLLNAMGYERQAKRKGGYPWGYSVLAAEKGLAVDTDGLPNRYLSRGETASLLQRALYVPNADGGLQIYQFERRPQEQKYYYLSPLGRDDNPGTEEAPWKSLHKAAFTVKAGSTVILEDGTYYEERSTIVRNSGTADEPIIFKARNPLKAKIVYPESTRLETKFTIETGIEYITLEGVEMTQVSMATEEDENKTSDIFYSSSGSHNSVIGNLFHHAYEEGVKFYLASDIVIRDNMITDTCHESIDLVNCENVRIYNNDLSEFGRIAFLGKGGTRNMRFYNNYIHNKEKTGSVGMQVGGSTDAQFCYDVSEGSGYESYNTVFYNNVVRAEKSGAVAIGISIASPKDAYIYNNVVIGTDVAYNLYSGGSMNKGWPWWAGVVNVYMRNNIFYHCKKFGEESIKPTNFVIENNLFFNTPGAPNGGNNKSGDPLFVDPEGDWHLQERSPARDSGAPWPDFPAFGGGTLEVERTDRDGTPYGEKWDIGIYNHE